MCRKPTTAAFCLSDPVISGPQIRSEESYSWRQEAEETSDGRVWGFYELAFGDIFAITKKKSSKNNVSAFSLLKSTRKKKLDSVSKNKNNKTKQ